MNNKNNNKVSEYKFTSDYLKYTVHHQIGNMLENEFRYNSSRNTAYNEIFNSEAYLETIMSHTKKLNSYVIRQKNKLFPHALSFMHHMIKFASSTSLFCMFGSESEYKDADQSLDLMHKSFEKMILKSNFSPEVLNEYKALLKKATRTYEALTRKIKLENFSFNSNPGYKFDSFKRTANSLLLKESELDKTLHKLTEAILKNSDPTYSRLLKRKEDTEQDIRYAENQSNTHSRSMVFLISPMQDHYKQENNYFTQDCVTNAFNIISSNPNHKLNFIAKLIVDIKETILVKNKTYPSSFMTFDQKEFKYMVDNMDIFNNIADLFAKQLSHVNPLEERWNVFVKGVKNAANARELHDYLSTNFR